MTLPVAVMTDREIQQAAEESCAGGELCSAHRSRAGCQVVYLARALLAERAARANIDGWRASSEHWQSRSATLEAENARLREAIQKVGTDCRYYADGCEEVVGPEREPTVWCGGCILAKAVK